MQHQALETVFPWLSAREVLGASSVCHAWRQLCGAQELWKQLVCGELAVAAGAASLDAVVW
jgi:hypothetical protein